MGLLISQLFIQQPDKLFDHINKKQIEQREYFISKLYEKFNEHKESDTFDEKMHKDMLTNYHVELTINNKFNPDFVRNESKQFFFDIPTYLRVIDIDKVTGEFLINDYTDIKKIFLLEIQNRNRNRIEYMVKWSFKLYSIEQYDEFIHDYPDEILSDIHIIMCKLVKNVF